MFSSLSLNSLLETHPIFKSISEIDDDEEPEKTKAYQLVHISSGNFFIWENKRSCLLTSNFRETLNGEKETIQTLLCQNPPLFQVRSIKFSFYNTHVALIGSRGVVILVLPKRWGRDADYEGGKNVLTCRTMPIAERFFTSNISVQLLQASWYPNASSPHLCLLTSENTLRIYDVVSDCDIPMQVHRLALDMSMPIGGSQMSLLSMYSVASNLGETVVSFDFSNTIDYTPDPTMFMKGKKQKSIQLQPIYLLQGNGDVLLLITSLTNNKFSGGSFYGPLIILPPAEDNYGTDSCSIHVMKTDPSVIVIATKSGRLHHCISLWSQNFTDDSDTLERFDAQSLLSKSLSHVEVSIKGEITPPTLYVYESVELDLSLSDDQLEHHFITLHEDSVLSCRYHCCTSIGIHTVALPWLDKIDAFIQEDDDNKQMLSELTNDDHCTVEHVLCTKSTASTQPCFIKGLTIASDPMLGPALVYFTADNHCSALPLLNTFRSSSPPLLSTAEDETLIESPLKKLKESSFDDHIRSLLKRNASQPIIRSGVFVGESSDKECFHLVTKATQILRDEYILKQKLAREAIIKRVQLLTEQKHQQIIDLERLNVVREDLTTNAEEIANTYEDCMERQQNLMERLDVVLKRVKTNNPVLSKAENDMSKELKTLSEKMRRVDNGIKQLKVKQEYQSKKLNQPDSVRDGFDLHGIAEKSLQFDRFKHILLEEGEKISELIKKLNNMNVQVGL